MAKCNEGQNTGEWWGKKQVNQNSIGDLIKRLREQKNLSQRKLAKLSGLDRSYICQLEAHKTRSITLVTARALAKGLGVRPEIFLSSRDSESLYLSTHVFEGILKEIGRFYDLSGEEYKPSLDPGDDNGNGGHKRDSL